MVTQPKENKIVRFPRVCVVSILDHVPVQRGKATVESSLSRIVVDRSLEGTIRLTRHVDGKSTRLEVPTDQGSEVIVQLLNELGAEFVVVSCNGDINLDQRAITEAASIGAQTGEWAVQYDLSIGDRSGFTYTFADFVQYRMIDLQPPLPPKVPSILGNLLLKAEIFRKHVDEIVLLPSATVWHRLMALRLVSLYGAPLELPIIAGWRRQQFGLGKVDNVRHNVASLSAFLDQTLVEASNERDQSGSLILLIALQNHICRLLFSNAAGSDGARLPGSAVEAIERSIDAALTDRSFRLVLAADIVDQMSLSSLKGLEYTPAIVEQRIGTSFGYAVEMNAFAGLGIDKEKLDRLSQVLLGDSANDAQHKEPIAPNILLLVSALSQSQSGTLRDLLIDNLSRLGESMDTTSSNDTPENQIARLPVESRAIAMALLIRILNALNLVPVAIWIRDRLRRLKLVA